MATTWLTDISQNLHFTSYFLVLKNKPVLSLSTLFLGSHRRFGDASAAQIHGEEKLVASGQGVDNPLPANLKVAIAAKPMGIDKATFSLLDNRSALRYQIQRAHRQHKTQPFQCLWRTNQRRLQLEPIGLVVQKVFL